MLRPASREKYRWLLGSDFGARSKTPTLPCWSLSRSPTQKAALRWRCAFNNRRSHSAISWTFPCTFAARDGDQRGSGALERGTKTHDVGASGVQGHGLKLFLVSGCSFLVNPSQAISKNQKRVTRNGSYVCRH